LDVQQLARAHTTQAVATLVKALDDPRHRVAAAQALLDRAWGRPVAMIAADPDRPLSIEFAWSDAAPNSHTDARAVGTQIEAAIIGAVAEASEDDQA
jgi:hypothetical protein